VANRMVMCLMTSEYATGNLAEVAPNAPYLVLNVFTADRPVPCMYVDCVLQNPTERVVLLEYGKSSSSTDIPSTVVGKNPPHNRHLNTVLAPKKLPGSTLLPSQVPSVPPAASDQPEIHRFSSDHYLTTDEVYSTGSLDF